jgi:hypothetical protein
MWRYPPLCPGPEGVPIRLFLPRSSAIFLPSLSGLSKDDILKLHFFFKQSFEDIMCLPTLHKDRAVDSVDCQACGY